MLVLFLVDILEEISIDRIRIDAFERDDEVRREPASSLDREHRRERPFHVFEDGKGDHLLEQVEILADDDASFYEPEAMERRLLGAVECERGGRDDDKECEQIITEENRRYRAGHRDDAERPVPVGALRVMVVLPSFPF